MPMNDRSSMPENQIKELLSQKYLEVIGSRTGYKSMKPDPDHGVDLTFTYPVEHMRPNGKRNGPIKEGNNACPNWLSLTNRDTEKTDAV